MAEQGITRNKEGVPQWTGDASSFQEYEEQALQWEQAVPHHKRGLCGPKLVAELSGTARKFVVGKRPDWLSYVGGVQRLMDHLRAHLGRPQIPELSEILMRYFRQSRRKKGESMNDFIVRKCEIYTRARQALSRVQNFYDGGRWQQQQSSSHTDVNWWKDRDWRQTWYNDADDEDQYPFGDSAGYEDAEGHPPWGTPVGERLRSRLPGVGFPMAPKFLVKRLLWFLVAAWFRRCFMEDAGTTPARLLTRLVPLG